MQHIKRHLNSSRKPKPLSFHQGQNLSIPPKETVVYTKQTQTTSSGGPDRDSKFFTLPLRLESFVACSACSITTLDSFQTIIHNCLLFIVVYCLGWLFNHFRSHRSVEMSMISNFIICFCIQNLHCSTSFIYL